MNMMACLFGTLRGTAQVREAALLKKWGGRTKNSKEWGRYLIVDNFVPKGEVVMLLPPYIISTLADLGKREDGLSFINALRVVRACVRAGLHPPVTHC